MYEGRKKNLYASIFKRFALRVLKQAPCENRTHGLSLFMYTLY